MINAIFGKEAGGIKKEAKTAEVKQGSYVPNGWTGWDRATYGAVTPFGSMLVIAIDREETTDSS